MLEEKTGTVSGKGKSRCLPVRITNWVTKFCLFFVSPRDEKTHTSLLGALTTSDKHTQSTNIRQTNTQSANIRQTHTVYQHQTNTHSRTVLENPPAKHRTYCHVFLSAVSTVNSEVYIFNWMQPGFVISGLNARWVNTHTNTHTDVHAARHSRYGAQHTHTNRLELE